MLINLAGKNFGRWKVLKRSCGDNSKQACWLCICICGNRKNVRSQSLRSGKSISCGCHRKEQLSKRSIVHGLFVGGKKGISEYWIWSGMLDRCYNSKSTGFYKYGARGIKVCNRWRNSFENFLEDMGRRPTKKHSIERVNNEGNYCPSNCKWATVKEQSKNKRTNRVISFRGENKILNEWCKTTGLSRSCLRNRLNRGWDVERALTTPTMR